MNENLARITKTISLICLSLNLILTPLFFLPFTTDFFGFNKLMLFLLLTAVSLVSWLVYNIATKTVRLTLSPMLLPVFLLATVAVISTLINRPASPDTWISNTAVYIAIFVYYLLATTLIQTSTQVKTILNWLIITSTVLGLLGIFSVLGAFEGLSLPAYIINKGFSPTGSLLNLVGLLCLTLPLSLVFAFKSRLGPKKLQYFLSSGIIISALILTGYQILPNRPFSVILLPKLASWSIAVDTFKSNILFGAGPGNFITQFNRFKPLNLNLTNFWAANFNSSGNLYFHLMTTLGLTGILAFLFIIYSWYKLSQRDSGTRITAIQLAINISLAVGFILGLFIPFTPLTWIILAGLLSLSVGMNKTKNLTKIKDVILSLNAITLIEPYQDTPAAAASTPLVILPWLLGIPVTLAIILAGFSASKIYGAEYTFYQSLVAANDNRGSDTYNLQIKTIQLKPNIDRYHVAYSNTNFALANSLATQENPTDQDKQTISTLVQQAIREARTAVELQPNKASNWQNLANLYRQLINFAQGANDFAVASYTRAIQLDPANAQLRLEMGSLMYALNNFTEATDRFKEATQLKPDYANAYYNLSYAFQKQEKWLEAYQTMQQAASLVPADSADAAKVQEELDILQTKLPAAAQPSPAPAQPGANQLQEPQTPPQAPTGFDKINLESPSPSPKAATPIPSPSL